MPEGRSTLTVDPTWRSSNMTREVVECADE